MNPVADHALTGVTVDLLGTGIDHQGVEFLDCTSVIDRDVLETVPNVLVWKRDDLGLSSFVDRGDRLEQRLGRQGHPFVADAIPPGTKFVTETLTASVPVIVIPPGWRISLIADPIADDGPGLQQGFPDLLVDFVAGEEPT